jgi:hypothetical protein
MAEVPDHLVPSDGLTNSKIRFAGFDLLEGGAQLVRFDIHNETQNFVASYAVEVGRSKGGNADTVIADGHAHMRSVLRQWLYTVDKLEQFYRKQAARTVTAE